MLVPVPPDDPHRVDALRALRILGTAPEPAFDDIARLAADLCAAPVASVTFVDARRRWRKAVVGLPPGDAPREGSFAAHVVAVPRGVLQVPDTLADPHWALHPSVVGRPWLRFYAGAAIVDREGHALGAVSVADHQPRRLPPRALTGLTALARQAAVLLELRHQASRPGQGDGEPPRRGLHDALTGLAGRALLHDHLEQALRARRRTDGEVGVVSCDLDAFRAVNDRLGHAGGDDLLRTVAMRLAGVARGSDVVARLEADAFVLVCPGLTGPADLQVLRERLRSAVEQPVTLAGTSLVPRVSLGAVLAEPGDDAARTLRRADAAMHAAKRAAPASCRAFGRGDCRRTPDARP